MAKLSTLFFWCNDVGAIRSFYSGLLGLGEVYADEQAVSYDINGTQMFFLKASSDLAVVTDWAAQPGYPVGSEPIPSWVLEVAPEQFESVVDKLTAGGVRLMNQEVHEHNGHRHLWVADPMGNTVAIHGPPLADTEQ